MPYIYSHSSKSRQFTTFFGFFFCCVLNNSIHHRRLIGMNPKTHLKSTTLIESNRKKWNGFVVYKSIFIQFSIWFNWFDYSWVVTILFLPFALFHLYSQFICSAHTAESIEMYKRAKIDHNFCWIQNVVTLLLCCHCKHLHYSFIRLRLIQMMLKWKWNGESMKNMFDWNSFKWCCYAISLAYTLFSTFNDRLSLPACTIAIAIAYTSYNACMWMSMCGCVAIHAHTQYRILSIWLNVVSTMHTQYHFRMVEKVAQPVSSIRNTVASQPLNKF